MAEYTGWVLFLYLFFIEFKIFFIYIYKSDFIKFKKTVNIFMWMYLSKVFYFLVLTKFYCVLLFSCYNVLVVLHLMLEQENNKIRYNKLIVIIS